MDRWTSSSQHKSLADLEALKAAEDQLLLANQLHAERAQEFEAKHSTLQARLDALTGAHHDLKTAHDALQVKYSTLLASQQSCIALLSSAFSCLKAF